jgi:beta-lactamase class D
MKSSKLYFRFLQVASLALFMSSCSVNKATIDDSLAPLYAAKKVEGCFTMLNNSSGEITVYNMEMDTTRVLPASTFKIPHALIALQTGVVTDENMILPWDGVVRADSAWNKDMNIKEAFATSCVPFFQTVARKIGKETMQQWLDSIGYGNKNINGPIDSFWLNNQLTISPDEQLGLMKRLYFDQLPFRKSVQQSVRSMMLQEDNTSYKLSYKTGWGQDKSGHSIGWIVGWIEENRHVYFFVNLLKTADPSFDMKKERLALTKEILQRYGFFEGKM